MAFALLAVVVPLALNFYDCIFLQAYEAYALSTPEERKGGFAMFALRSLVITPVVFSAAFVSGGSSLSAAATVVEDVADNTIETSQSRLSIRSSSSSTSPIVDPPDSPGADEASEQGTPSMRV